jgi:hypothetical protein
LHTLSQSLHRRLGVLSSADAIELVGHANVFIGNAKERFSRRTIGHVSGNDADVGGAVTIPLGVAKKGVHANLSSYPSCGENAGLKGWL